MAGFGTWREVLHVQCHWTRTEIRGSFLINTRKRRIMLWKGVAMWAGPRGTQSITHYKKHSSGMLMPMHDTSSSNYQEIATSAELDGTGGTLGIGLVGQSNICFFKDKIVIILKKCKFPFYNYIERHENCYT